ncbi:MAG: GTP 3',8-cyclase MoaA [Myxococcales bacterium]|nr:GTP 3',8-cyclase MoaA [Myxococcales bacterium]
MAPESASPLVDARGRPLTDLRLSVTDRCNFRCRYCMPKEHFGRGFKFLPRSEILSFEELTRVARAFVTLGVKKLRLTGGEPLLRSDLPELIRQLSGIGDVDLALTTNGALLAERADDLAAAGLRRVTVSLDSLDEPTFRAMTDTEFSPSTVLAGIDAAARAGLGPIKINAVIRRGQNDGEIVALARHFKGSGHIVRFIEYMDVGATNGWAMDQVVSGREIVELISRDLPLEPASPSQPGEVAKRWRYVDGDGEIGVITSVTQPFCGACSRARLSAKGTVYTCLFATTGTDLRGPLRSGCDDAALAEHIRGVWAARTDRYSELRSESSRAVRRIEMSYIGG